jgi:hypothetical protein
VNQFGTVIDADGVLQLNAQYVGLWSAINFVSQVVFQFISPFSANRFGLKFNMYTFTAMITLVNPPQILSSNTDLAGYRIGDRRQDLVCIPDCKGDLWLCGGLHWDQRHGVYIRNHDAKDARGTSIRILTCLRHRRCCMCHRTRGHPTGTPQSNATWYVEDFAYQSDCAT